VIEPDGTGLQLTPCLATESAPETVLLAAQLAAIG